jgi:hypothetical protein
MSQHQRQRFLTTNDWHTFIARLTSVDPNTGQPSIADPGAELLKLRHQVYSEIEALRQRPLLVYATRFPTPPNHPASFATSIDLTDVDGFADLVGTTPEADAVDVLLHSAGGSAEATERIVALLRGKFKRVDFLIPHSAYSAATMLALSGDEVILHPAATLGPIDPQLNGVPARAIQRGFENARNAIKKTGPEALPAYLPLIEKYSLHLLELCSDSLELSESLVRDWLNQYMFKHNPKSAEVVEAAVKFFSAYELHLTHSRSLTFDRVFHLGLHISQPEQYLGELMREAHILLQGFFGITAFVKLFENNRGLSWGTQQQVLQTAPQRQNLPFSIE